MCISPPPPPPPQPVERSIAEEPKSAVPAAGTFRSFIDLGDDVEGVDGEEVDGEEVGQQDEVDGMMRTDSTGAKYHPLGSIQVRRRTEGHVTSM